MAPRRGKKKSESGSQKQVSSISTDTATENAASPIKEQQEQSDVSTGIFTEDNNGLNEMGNGEESVSEETQEAQDLQNSADNNSLSEPHSDNNEKEDTNNKNISANTPENDLIARAKARSDKFRQLKMRMVSTNIWGLFSVLTLTCPARIEPVKLSE